MKKTRSLVFCAMVAALSVVLLLIGGWIGVGTYAAPALAGFLMLPLGRRVGKKQQLCVWIAASLLAWMLVSDREEVLIFACFFGWYPIAKPSLDLLGKKGLVLKLLIFNAVIIAVEALVMLVLVPESETPVMLLILLCLGNLAFLMYDRVLPRMDVLMERRIGKLF